jgi:hypothetical protein
MCLFIWILLVRSRIKMEDADATELETPASSKPSSARKISQKHASTVTSMTIAAVCWLICV